MRAVRDLYFPHELKKLSFIGEHSEIRKQQLEVMYE